MPRTRPPSIAQRDANEPAIINALRHCGATVEQLSQKDVPDLLVGYEDPITGEPRNLLMEVKTGKGKLRPGQEQWHEGWHGQVAVVRTVDDALALIGRAEKRE